MLHLLCSGEDCERFARDVGLLVAPDAHHPLELVWEDFDEAGHGIGPVVENPFGAPTTSQIEVPRDEVLHNLQVAGIDERFEIDRIQIAALIGEVSALIIDIGDAAAHAAAKLRPQEPRTRTNPFVMYSQP